MRFHFGTWLRAMTRKAATGPRAHRTAKRTRPQRIVPRLEALEDRCVPSAGISLTPSVPAPQLVGEPITWTATDPNATAGTVYQFDVGSPGGAFRMVRDFSPVNQFTWAPMSEGNYRIKVVDKDGFAAADTQSAVVTDLVNSRVTGPDAVITPTANPLVALYSVPPGPVGTVHVEFAVAANNPSWRSTNDLPSSPSRSTNFFVAGMLPSTTYEMRDVFSDGTTSAPLLFTTGAIPSSVKLPSFTVVQPPGPGSDTQQDLLFQQLGSPTGGFPNPYVTDLAGNVVWYYDVLGAGFHGVPAMGADLVPGGTVLLTAADSRAPFTYSQDVLREIDLAGDPVRETNLDAINAQLTALGHNNVTSLTHDVERLPNGQTAVIALTERTVNISGTPTNYVGADIIVLDENFQVSWVWDGFDHLDVNRGPTLGETDIAGVVDPEAAVPNLPAVDWLHANSVNWSPADGNLTVSLRNQDWVIKIDYANGTGDGHVIWRLGQGGDFTANSTDPSPWFTHQHDAHFINDSTMIVFDDGDVRRASDPTADSRGQVWKIDEQTMTATLVFNDDLGNYSDALGSAQRLSNGNYSFDSGRQGVAPHQIGQAIEVQPDGSKAYVLQLNKPEYRSFRIQTLYQGISDQLTVTSAADDGSAGTLRSEIALAQSGDTITFDPSLAGQTITLTSGELAVSKSLDIVGPGAALLTVSGNNASRVFDISGSSTNVEISGLTIAGGSANSTTAVGPFGNVTMGGAILNAGAHVTLSHVALDDNRADGTAVGYVQTNLVSDIPGLAQLTDPNLKDPWGIAESGSGPFSVADQNAGVATAYSVTAGGVSALPSQTVAIPTTTFGKAQGPSGQVFNDTNSFLVNGTPATFIYAGLNGAVYAWNSSLGTTAQIEAATAGALYSGLDIESTASGDFLYAADPKQDRVDVFDGTFQPVNLGAGAFVDPQLPAGLAPFNVEGINGDVYVAYAPPGPTHYAPPEGVGAVAVFDTSGHFIKQLIAGGQLASPWGLVLAPSTFGQFGGDLLVGNFGYTAPEINAFDPATGAYLGTITDGSGNTLLGNGQGIWDMSFGNGGNGGLPNTLYVTTGLNAPAGVSATPGNDGSDGLLVAIDALPNIAQGGAVGNVGGGTLDVSRSTFTDNQAIGAVRGAGGALAILSGTAAIRYTTITGNDAAGIDGANGGDGFGGGVYVGGGTVTVGHSTITDNDATGGAGRGTGTGGVGQGGGIANLGDVGSATLTVSHSTLSDNQAEGGTGGNSGNGEGGGIVNENGARLTVTYSTLADNSAIGAGRSKDGVPPEHNGAGNGGGIQNNGIGAVAVVSQSFLWGNRAIGGDGVGGAAGGLGRAGAINTGFGATLTVTDSILSDNQALGGAGGPGGNGGNGGSAVAGAILNSSGALTVIDSIFADNEALGGAGGAGGSGGQGGAGGLALGGAIVSAEPPIPPRILPTLDVSGSLFFANEAVGGAGAAGGVGGNAQGGALAIAAGTAAISDTIITGNEAEGGDGGAGANGGNGQGGGAYNGATSNLTLQRSLIVGNEAGGGAAGAGGTDGQGVGGGLYLTPGGVACADLWTIIAANHASTSDDDVFGTFGSC